MTDLRQTVNYTRYLQFQGWLTKKANNQHLFIRHLPLIPLSIIKIQRPVGKINLKQIGQLIRKHQPAIVYFEPSSLNQLPLLAKNGFRLKKSAFLPTKTLEISLTQPEKKIFKQMKKDSRYAIKKAKNKNIIIKKTENLKKFRHFWKKSVDWQRWTPSHKSLRNLKKAFGKKAIFLTAAVDHKIIAGATILLTKHHAYYYYAFTAKTGRRLSAQYLLVWKAIKLAKKANCQIFDFEGIYDSRFPNKSWLGFTHFKKSFGGQEVQYPGCFAKFYSLFPCLA